MAKYRNLLENPGVRVAVILGAALALTQPSRSESPTILLQEARTLAATGKMIKAEEVLRSYLEDHPTSAEGHFLLGYVLFRENRPQESLAEFTSGARTERPPVAGLQTVAADYVLLGDFADADKWFSEVTKENPLDPNAWYLLGRTQYNENRFAEAVASFERATGLRPKYVIAEDNLGLSWQGLGELDKARAAYQTAISWEQEATVDNEQPYLNLGSLLIDQGDPKSALSLLNKAAAISPSNPKVREELGRGYQAANMLPEAQTELERAVELAPDTSGLHFKLGQVYLRLGKQDLARRQFEICTKLNGAHSSSDTPNP